MSNLPNQKITAENFIANLSNHLFWDVKRESLNFEEDKLFLVGRILEYGLMDDWNALKEVLTIAEIANLAKELRNLDAVSLRFIATISNSPIEDFRCYNNKQFLQGHWSY